MKKLTVLLIALIGIAWINSAECKPLPESMISDEAMHFSTWFNRCRNKLSQQERKEYFTKNATQKEIFLRVHCMSVKNGGFIVPPNIKIAPDNKDLKLKYIQYRSKQGGFLAGGIVFMLLGVGDAVGAYFAYQAYDAAPEKTALKDRMLETTIILSVVSGVSAITSFIFFGTSHKYRMEANGIRVDLQISANGISGTF